MATLDNQQTFLPYSSTINKDCSQGFCSIYCPQWCYILFSPPPPLPLAALDDDSASAFSPLVIAVIAILASALLLFSYYTFVSKNCVFFSFTRRSVNIQEDSAGSAAVASARLEDWRAPPASGLEEAQIKKIAFLRYGKEGSFVDGTECSVCLGEFREGEELRLLPKCNHAFHLQCIDTWLEFHANCPLCRRSLLMEVDLDQDGLVMSVEEEEGGEIDRVEIGGGDAGFMGSSGAYRGQVSIGDVLQMSMEEEYLAAKNCGLVGEGGIWGRREGEQNRGNGRNRGLNCVVRTVRMKRSVSSGRFLFGRQRRGRNFLLPV